MATIYVDNKAYQVSDGQNLLHACLSAGLDLPYFCWHPAMHSVGACRQCAVKVFKDAGDMAGRIAMACMTPVKDGLRLSIEDPQAVEFRRSVIEWLMVNHPHDCPVCDEGGECHLQDMTVMTGHEYRRFRFNKRTYRNQYLGPFVTHEMNRCIQCYRCVRFYRDFAGGHDFDVMGWHDRVYFGRSCDGVLQSEFTGNLVEICPTGVFTDKTLGTHYTRKWDLQTAPSVCVHCGLGCNTIPAERYGTLRRVHNRYNSQVNGYFLCDRGRYGYEFVNGPRRFRQPMRRSEQSQLESADAAMIVGELASMLAAGKRVIGIGSPRASLESNFALAATVGAGNFYAGLSEPEHRLAEESLAILQAGPARSPSLREIESCDAAFVLGEDPTNASPMLAFALRQMTRQKAIELARRQQVDPWNVYPLQDLMQHDYSPLFLATPDASKLDEVSAGTHRAAPADLARLGFAVARLIDPQAGPAVELPAEAQVLAGKIAQSLQQAKRPVVVAGPSLMSPAILHAAANVAWALCRTGRPCGLFLTSPQCNSTGLAMMDTPSLDSAIESLRDQPAAAIIVLESDLHRQAPRHQVDALRSGGAKIFVIDSLLTSLAATADGLLPCGTFAQCDGTLVNNEGRAQRFFRVFVGEPQVQEPWRWLGQVLERCRRPRAWDSLDRVIADLIEHLPQFASIVAAAPSADYRLVHQKIPRQPHRYSGRTAMYASYSQADEPPPPEDVDSALRFSMEGAQAQPPSSLVPHYWAPQWNSVQALNKFQQEVGGPMRFEQSGVRLIEPSAGAAPPYFNDVPDSYRPRAGQWLLVPAWHIFGSEELSSLSPAVAELVPAPYVALNAADATQLGLAEGQMANVRVADQDLGPLAVRIRPQLPASVALLPHGLRDQPYVELPAMASISPVAGRSGGDGGGA